jgi:transcriptional regulator with XRE-family HTH domain
MTAKRLAMNVKTLRRQRKLNQTALAKRVGVTQAYIAMLEKGSNVNPTLRMLAKLAKALKVTVAELVK